MSPTSQHSPDSPGPSNLVGSRANRRRDKPQLSCNLCRRRKLKCDRCQPCSTCVIRGLSLSCTYVQSNSLDQRPPAKAAASMQERIGQLENLVMTLKTNLHAERPGPVSNTPTPGASPPYDNEQVEVQPFNQSEQITESIGRINLENDGAKFVESAHWTAILDGISDLKDQFETETGTSDAESDHEEAEFPFGMCKPASKHDILMALPTRPVVDRLVARYFSNEIAPSIIHGPTFLKQYERFWETPYEAPVMWIGLLCGVICLATLDQQAQSTATTTPGPLQPCVSFKQSSEIYREKVVQCLVLGKYTKTVPYTIDTLIIYMFIEYHQSQDAQIEVWVLLGIIARLAIRMGYHRDGSHFSRISPFEAEMRRRKWTMIYLFDRALSVQAGLPSMIRAPQCDTAEPRSLLDQDFHEDILELPPPRPDSEPTYILFLNTKNRLLAVFTLITDLMTRVQPSTYAEVMQLDKQLLQTYHAIPKVLQIKSMSSSIMDNEKLIMSRIFLLLVFHKAQITLHRKYLLPARTNLQFAYSRTTCLEAALQTLKYQATIDQESQPDGRFATDKWKISSLVKMEFLFSTTILCLYLNHDISAPSSAQVNSPFLSQEDNAAMRDRIVTALTTSYHIWLPLSTNSKEAQKATQVLRVLLTKANAEPVQPKKNLLQPTARRANQAFTPSASTSSSSASGRSLATPRSTTTPLFTAGSSSLAESQYLDMQSLDSQSLAPADPNSTFSDMLDFDMASWLPPDVKGGFGYFRDARSDVFDMANWNVVTEFGSGDGSGALAGDFDGFEEIFRLG